MRPSTPSGRTVDILADVVAQGPDGRLTVKGTGRDIGVSVGSLNAYRGLTALLRRSRSERRQLLTRLGHVLSGTGLRLSFQIDGREIAHAGTNGTGWLSRALALPGVRIRVGPLLAALVRPSNTSRGDT